MPSMSDAPRPLTGRRVLTIALTAFGLVLLINSVFIYLALDTFSGLSTDDAYVRGLRYNETLAANEAQQRLGWTADVAVDRAADGQVSMRVGLRDASDTPLAGLVLSGELRRPVREGRDHQVIFEAIAPGQYRARIAGVDAGQWDLALRAVNAAGAEFRREQRLWLK
jgi:nitrogen fixation protein FixH